jgi:AraC-like DNA-binding protein
MDDLPSDLRAIVRPMQALRHFTLERFDPDARLGRFVDRFWRTSWDLPEPFEQTIVAFPVVNLVFQADGSATFTGVQRSRDERRLEGTGWALGAMFRPGGFRPLSGVSMATLTGRRFPAEGLFGPPVRELAAALIRTDDILEQVRLITAFLDRLLPDEPTIGEDLSALIEAAASDAQPVTQVSELARRHRTSVRTLQRLFAEHVGMGPKAVLDRYRVLAAAELARNPPASWSEVVHRLGYADQAHLTADLSSTFGAPPAAYARDQSS